MNGRKIKKPKSLTLLALEKIREGIISGKHALGSPLSENVLAESFGISKTPVREALVQLQREGLVVVYPHTGTFVFQLADGDISELCELRLILETNAVQLAMTRHARRLTAKLDGIVKAMSEAIEKRHAARYRELNVDFHRAFFQHCGNAYLGSMYATIEAKLQTLRSSLVTPLPHLLSVSHEDHRKIADALRESNVDVALGTLTEHIRRVRDLMRGLKEIAPITVEKYAPHPDPAA